MYDTDLNSPKGPNKQIHVLIIYKLPGAQL